MPTFLPSLAQQFAIGEKANSYTMRGIDIQSAHLEVLSASLTGKVNGITTSNYIASISGWYPNIGNTIGSQILSLLTAGTNSITWSGSPTANDGYITFNGVTQSGNIGNLLNITNTAFTIACWLNAPNAPQTFGAFLAKRQTSGTFAQYQCGIGYVNGSGTGTAGQQFGFFGFNGTNLQGMHTNANVADGTWHHVAVTRDGSGTFLMYLDGVSTSFTVDNVGVVSENYTNTGNFMIGHADGSTYYQGSVSDVVVCTSTAFSSSQIASLYNSQYAIQHEKGLF